METVKAAPKETAKKIKREYRVASNLKPYTYKCLEKDAEKKGLGVGTLASSILHEYYSK